MTGEWKHKVLNVSESSFEKLALEVFRFQYRNNPVYKAYTDALGLKAGGINAIQQIPFLPIRFFKSHEIKTTDFFAEDIFESSGTTGVVSSKHFIKDTAWYESVFLKAFELFYGSVRDWCIIGLLPSYPERKNSSLVYMVNKLIAESNHLQSGFYLDEFDILAEVLFELENSNQKTLLIGVTFALLDFAEKHSLRLENTIVMETGGMKGRREEMIREEVHQLLKNAFGITAVHSEYGMTELLSQAYSKGEGILNTPPWMKVLVRDDEDPLELRMPSADRRMAYVTGAINIIDLANIYSCSFIATDDIGKVYSDKGFEILGRMDDSDLRGCSLLAI
jgi:phenylacetate-coenzyme A ligase PaaK-like adenylate-forming protein